jgi:hypothetical protein
MDLVVVSGAFVKKIEETRTSLVGQLSVLAIFTQLLSQWLPNLVFPTLAKLGRLRIFSDA